MEGTQKGYLFCQKWYIKGKGSDLGAEPSRIKFVLVPPPPFPPQETIIKLMFHFIMIIFFTIWKAAVSKIQTMISFVVPALCYAPIININLRVSNSCEAIIWLSM